MDTAVNVNKSRGRGRGRRENPVTSSDKAPGHNVKDTDAKVNILALLQSGSVQAAVDFLDNAHGDILPALLDDVVDKVCNSILENVEVVENSAGLFKRLWDDEFKESALVRRSLLLRLQKQYTGRDGLTDAAFQGYASFLCELFSQLRVQGHYLLALVAPVYAVLTDFLKQRDKSQDNLLTFHMLMCKHGLLLEKVAKDKMAELINIIRGTLLTETAKTANSRLKICVLLEIVELYASNWVLSDDVKQYYSDKLADIMTEIE
ncbi:MIF4G domain-containing protein-like [Rhopilema esculentum]|uniref:MIF4G domain-containing protein-like n=1 Tax=Rhopilema esculentum TaxID=499914 RepID=UPI0031CF38D0|eukprot:gene8885-16510_t